jgi:carbon monoxide dehydrogenase subunit G
MTRTTVTRLIRAPADVVFRTVADIAQFSKAIPHIVKVEFLSDRKSGLGTRFRETRSMNGREMRTELEMTEYVENQRARLVADTHGTVWDSLFEVAAETGQTRLTLTMDARPHRLLPRLMNPLIRGMVQKALERDMDAVKAYCEK